MSRPTDLDAVTDPMEGSLWDEDVEPLSPDLGPGGLDQRDDDAEAIAFCVSEGLIDLDGTWWHPDDLIGEGWSAEEIKETQQQQRDNRAARQADQPSEP